MDILIKKTVSRLQVIQNMNSKPKENLFNIVDEEIHDLNTEVLCWVRFSFVHM